MVLTSQVCIERLESRIKFSAIAPPALADVMVDLTTTFNALNPDNLNPARIYLGGDGKFIDYDLDGDDDDTLGKFMYRRSTKSPQKASLELTSGRGIETVIAVFEMTFTSGGAGTFVVNLFGPRTFMRAAEGTLRLSVPKGRGALQGLVKYDRNNNSFQDGFDRSAVGVRVFIDRNADGIWQRKETSVFTAANGEFVFPDVAAGFYRVGVGALPGTIVQGAPKRVHEFVAVPRGEPVHPVKFLYKGTGSISGSILDDINRSYRIDSGDRFISHRTHSLFLDLNRDGVFLDLEPSLQVSGEPEFAFTGLVPGTYTIRVQQGTFDSPESYKMSVFVGPGETVSGITFLYREV